MRSRIEMIPIVRAPSTTGRWRKPPWIMRLAACPVVSIASTVSGPWVIDAETGPSTFPVATARRTSRSVRMPTSRSSVEHDDRADAALVHLAGCLGQADRAVDREQVGRHDLADGGHGAIVNDRRRWRLARPPTVPIACRSLPTAASLRGGVPLGHCRAVGRVGTLGRPTIKEVEPSETTFTRGCSRARMQSCRRRRRCRRGDPRGGDDRRVQAHEDRPRPHRVRLDAVRYAARSDVSWGGRGPRVQGEPGPRGAAGPAVLPGLQGRSVRPALAGPRARLGLRDPPAPPGRGRACGPIGATGRLGRAVRG